MLAILSLVLYFRKFIEPNTKNYVCLLFPSNSKSSRVLYLCHYLFFTWNFVKGNEREEGRAGIKVNQNHHMTRVRVERL